MAVVQGAEMIDCQRRDSWDFDAKRYTRGCIVTLRHPQIVGSVQYHIQDEEQAQSLCKRWARYLQAPPGLDEMRLSVAYPVVALLLQDEEEKVAE